MTTTAARTEQLEGTLSADTRPLAALAVEADDLPSFLEWQTDDREGCQFAIVPVGEWKFALETDDEEPYQTTVYGVETGEALDQLLQVLGLDDEVVLDRVDREDSPDATGVAIGAMAGAATSVVLGAGEFERHLQEYAARLSAIEARVAREAYNRGLAAVLELRGEELTARERMTLSLLSAGWTTEEAADEMGVTPPTVLKYSREAVKRWLSAAGTEKRFAIPEVDAPTLRERIVAMRHEGMTFQAIADRLNSEGVPTLRGGSEWRPSSVQSTGRYVRGKRHVRKNVPSG